MSVRRLAANQPESFAFSKETMKEARWWMDKYPPERKQSAIIPIMWLVQKQEGWVPWRNVPIELAVSNCVGAALSGSTNHSPDG
jgi:NADH:ubiquinone oxidoreductase subunit E